MHLGHFLILNTYKFSLKHFVQTFKEHPQLKLLIEGSTLQIGHNCIYLLLSVGIICKFVYDFFMYNFLFKGILWFGQIKVWPFWGTECSLHIAHPQTEKENIHFLPQITQLFEPIENSECISSKFINCSFSVKFIFWLLTSSFVFSFFSSLLLFIL